MRVARKQGKKRFLQNVTVMQGLVLFRLHKQNTYVRIFDKKIMPTDFSASIKVNVIIDMQLSK
jgi:hypothetical protein